MEHLLLQPPSVFTTPAWMEAWWDAFGGPARLSLLSVKESGRVVGLAPLLIRSETAFFIGSSDVCDYLDFIVQPGEEQCFCAAVIRHLLRNGVNRLELHSLRADGAAMAGLAGASAALGMKYSRVSEAVSVELELPRSWDLYLQEILNKKQRHEVRRKLRRLAEAGPYTYTDLGGEAAMQFIPHFLNMFRKNPEKADFLAGNRESFFFKAIRSAIKSAMARFGVLELKRRTAAAVLCFDYRDGIYLYNSAYEPDFGPVSAGLLCKVLSIKDAIAKGRSIYDFLKGAEEYKYRLGGRDLTVFHCTVIRPDNPGCSSRGG